MGGEPGGKLIAWGFVQLIFAFGFVGCVWVVFSVILQPVTVGHFQSLRKLRRPSTGETKTNETLESERLLRKEWNRYKMWQHMQELQVIQRAFKLQATAIDELKKISPELSAASLQVHRLACLCLLVFSLCLSPDSLNRYEFMHVSLDQFDIWLRSIARSTPFAARGNWAARECAARRELRGSRRTLLELDANIRKAAGAGCVLRGPRAEARRRHSTHSAGRSVASKRQRAMILTGRDAETCTVYLYLKESNSFTQMSHISSLNSCELSIVPMMARGRIFDCLNLLKAVSSNISLNIMPTFM